MMEKAGAPIIAVVGSVNIDIVVKCASRPKPGETIMGQYHDFIPGGKGANQACAASRLGSAVSMLGCIGSDPLGSIVLDSLRQFGVSTSSLNVLDGEQTGAAFITVDGSGENSIILTSGANGRLTPEMVERNRQVIDEAHMTIAQLEIPLPVVERAAEMTLSGNGRFVLNPTPVREIADDSVLWNSTLFVVNEHEAEYYSGVAVKTAKEALKAARALVERGVGMAIVTMGESGSVVKSAQEEVFVEAVTADAVDTTAAGDVYIGGFCAEWLRTGSVERAMRYASRAAAISVSRFGAQTSIPSDDEVLSAVREH
jgi:ribokinase